MLGAQSIQIKQRSKEKKKKLPCLELQCERIQKAAREDEAKFLERVARLHLEDARAVSEIAEETKRIKQRRHHSAQEPSSVHLSLIDHSSLPRSISKSPSTSFTRTMKPERSGLDSTNPEEDVNEGRFSRWCGLFATSFAGSSRQPSKKLMKRRMSTFV